MKQSSFLGLALFLYPTLAPAYQIETTIRIQPDAAPVQHIYRTLQSEGFRITHRTNDGSFMTIKGDKATYENKFGVRVVTDNSGTKRMLGTFKAPTKLSFVANVSGLDDSKKRHPHHVVRANAAAEKIAAGYSPSDIASHYGFDKMGFTGAGQSIAIATFDDFDLDNVKLFFLFNFGAAAPVVDKVPFNGTPDYNEDSALETTMDIEFSAMTAPKSTIHVFSSAHNNEKGELDLFNAILDDGRAKVVNYSWGICEQDISVQHFADMQTVFARAAAMGVNIFVASGDAGSRECKDVKGNAYTGVSFPASSPDVIAVGGTSIQTWNKNTAEIAWDGSGGGISTLFAAPAYQAALVSNDPHRMIPDVAFNADPAYGQAVYTSYKGTRGFLEMGGTSMAAPQWAGFLALVNEARARAGKKPLGFLNPILYGFSDAQIAVGFRDIELGSNGDYSATPGWDPTTGLGSMNGPGLLEQLVAQP